MNTKIKNILEELEKKKEDAAHFSRHFADISSASHKWEGYAEGLQFAAQLVRNHLVTKKK